MRTVDQKELDAFKRKKGFKVKRKMGAQKKKPGSEKKERKAESGAMLPEVPIPASPAPVAAPVPAPIIDMKPFASMSASIASSNARLEKVIANNTQALEKVANRANASYRHKVKRDAKLLIDEVISTAIQVKT